jgi:hypothetical protein
MYRRCLRRRCGFSGFSGRISEGRFATAIGDLEAIDLDRFPTLPLMRRAYGLRAKPPYDATYVALAELLGCELLTVTNGSRVTPTVTNKIPAGVTPGDLQERTRSEARCPMRSAAHHEAPLLEGRDPEDVVAAAGLTHGRGGLG